MGEKVVINPFIGLNSINKEEYKNLSSFDLYQKVEELAPSFQEGQVSDLFLFLLFINILEKAKIDFLVKGGIILTIYLGEHIRRGKDIDVIVKDPDLFFKEVNEALEKYHGDFVFKTKWIKKSLANEDYYNDTFAFSVDAYHDDILIKSFVVDGKFNEHYDEIEKVRYSGPSIIEDNFSFYGVNIEYITSEKILASTSEQVRPIKHLIDLYSLIKCDLDINKLKDILKQSLKEENEVRKRLNIPQLEGTLIVSEKKEFMDSYFLEAISAGYVVSKDEMIKEINKWLKDNINH